MEEKMIIEKIYFDMDGVLADFDGGMLKLCGRQPLDQSNKTPADDDALWAAVRKVDNFYDKLEPMPGALEMFKTLYEKYGSRCEILSGIPKPKRGITTSREDKIAWVRRYLSEDMVINLVYRAEKKDYVKGPGCILIDDLGINIEEWNAAGGTGVLYLDAEQTLKEIEKLELA